MGNWPWGKLSTCSKSQWISRRLKYHILIDSKSVFFPCYFQIYSFYSWNLINVCSGGRLGGSVGWASDFGSGHELTVGEFEPCIGLCADSLQPGACFKFYVSLSLCSSPTQALSLSPSKINKNIKKIKNKMFAQMSAPLVCSIWDPRKIPNILILWLPLSSTCIYQTPITSKALRSRTNRCLYWLHNPLLSPNLDSV